MPTKTSVGRPCKKLELLFTAFYICFTISPYSFYTLSWKSLFFTISSFFLSWVDHKRQARTRAPKDGQFSSDQHPSFCLSLPLFLSLSIEDYFVMVLGLKAVAMISLNLRGSLKLALVMKGLSSILVLYCNRVALQKLRIREHSTEDCNVCNPTRLKLFFKGLPLTPR